MRTATFRRFAVLATSMVMAAGSLVALPAVRAETTTITAIGDSYLAGIGAGSYSTSAGCRRSSNSPTSHLARRAGARLIDLSCPGDTISRASQAATALDPDTDLVVIQIGGNDLGFVTLAGSCLIAGDEWCQRTITEAHRRLPQIRSGILALVRQVRLTAPTAETLVLGYPRLLGPPRRCDHVLGAQRVRNLDRLQRTLDRVIRSAARTAGAGFVDWPRTVDRASLCSVDPWYALPGDRFDDLLHPDSRATLAMGRHLAREWSR